MATWITDRTKYDVDRVNELHEKANYGTWTATEQAEWVAGMKGALSSSDFNRIERGIQELASILSISINVKTDWAVDGYLTASDAYRWLNNINTLRQKFSVKSSTPSTPSSMSPLSYQLMNQIEQILFDMEQIAKDVNLYCSEPICGGEPYYALC